jgi:thiamine biosynthesis protein ThiS
LHYRARAAILADSVPDHPIDIAAMQVTINGERRELAAGLSIAELLRELGIDGRKVAVERNLEIVPKSTFALTRLGEGDRLEIVHFIGGG